MAVIDEQSAVAVNVAHLSALARSVLVDHGAAGGELSLTFVDEDVMADLNQRYLDGDGPTDVLAFPLDGLPDAEPPADSAVPTLLGDVIVCPSVAERNAGARSVAIGDELALLVVHGVLHVLGMDHAEPGQALEMQSAERRLLAGLHPPSDDGGGAGSP